VTPRWIHLCIYTTKEGTMQDSMWKPLHMYGGKPWGSTNWTSAILKKKLDRLQLSILMRFLTLNLLQLVYESPITLMNLSSLHCLDRNREEEVRGRERMVMEGKGRRRRWFVLTLFGYVVRENGGKGGEQFKIFPPLLFPLILGVNKMRGIGGNEGEIFPSAPFPSLSLNIFKHGE